MSIFRTIKKIRDCDSCHGTGRVVAQDKSETDCVICQGTGKVEILSRVGQAAASRASSAARELPPRERAAARERLQDHEPEVKDMDPALPSKGKQGKVSKVGTGFIDEE